MASVLTHSGARGLNSRRQGSLEIARRAPDQIRVPGQPAAHDPDRLCVVVDQDEAAIEAGADGPVVPEPAKQSSTTDPGELDARTILSIKGSGFCVG